MRTVGDLNLEELQHLVNQDAGADITFKSIDTDGDGQSDMFLIDKNGDGHIDAVIRVLDADGDGVNDSYIAYDQDEHIQSIGQISTDGDLTIFRQSDEEFAPIMAGIITLEDEVPTAELFTTFDDPYIETNYGSFSDTLEEPVPDVVVVDASAIEEVFIEDFATLSDAVYVEGFDDLTDTELNSRVEEEKHDITITEVGDASGDGSGVFVRVDDDADGVWDRKEDLVQTVDGWEADIDNDGLSQTVVIDEDQDGMADRIDVTGEGSEVSAWELVDSVSQNLVDNDRFELDDEDDLERIGATYDSDELDDQDI